MQSDFHLFYVVIQGKFCKYISGSVERRYININRSFNLLETCTSITTIIIIIVIIIICPLYFQKKITRYIPNAKNSVNLTQKIEPSWEYNNFSVNQEFPCSLRHTQFHWPLHNSPQITLSWSRLHHIFLVSVLQQLVYLTYFRASARTICTYVTLKLYDYHTESDRHSARYLLSYKNKKFVLYYETLPNIIFSGYSVFFHHAVVPQSFRFMN